MYISIHCVCQGHPHLHGTLALSGSIGTVGGTLRDELTQERQSVAAGQLQLLHTLRARHRCTRQHHKYVIHSRKWAATSQIPHSHQSHDVLGWVKTSQIHVSNTRKISVCIKMFYHGRLRHRYVIDSHKPQSALCLIMDGHSQIRYTLAQI